jgi:hypothetical protein
MQSSRLHTGLIPHTHFQQLISSIHHSSCGHYSRAPLPASPSPQTQGLRPLPLPAPRKGSGHEERAQGPAGWGEGREGASSARGKPGDVREGSRARVGPEGAGREGSCSRRQPVVTTASSGARLSQEKAQRRGEKVARGTAALALVFSPLLTRTNELQALSPAGCGGRPMRF